MVSSSFPNTDFNSCQHACPPKEAIINSFLLFMKYWSNSIERERTTADHTRTHPPLSTYGHHNDSLGTWIQRERDAGTQQMSVDAVMLTHAVCVVHWHQ